jgi:response regulator of citrate/malate metabolism
MESYPSVLIVEDEAIMAMLLERRIKAKGYSICGTASTKEEAVSLALKNSSDLS